jgi:hypothetical protein
MPEKRDKMLFIFRAGHKGKETQQTKAHQF